MNTPNPLVPQGTFPDKGKAQVRITVFAILGIHLLALGVLLIAGCNKKAEPEQAATENNTGIPPLPTPPIDTNWPAPPPAGTAATPGAPVDAGQAGLTGQLPPPVGTTQDVASIPPVNPIPPVQPDPVPPAPSGSEHTISKGESFYTIGKKYGVGFKAIADANPGVNPTRLKIGQKIVVPAGKAPVANGGAAAAPSGESTVKSYKVKSGDNLMKIAKNQGASVKEIRALNGLKTDRITVGQTLKIPVKAPVVVPPPVEAVPAVPAPVDTLAPPPAVPAPTPGLPAPPQ